MITRHMKIRALVSFLVLGLFLSIAPAWSDEPAVPALNPETVEYKTGTLHRLGETEIVIDDCLYKLAENVRFLSSLGTTVERRWFVVGKTVKFYKNDDSTVLIVRLP
ncbi:hypothetical protein JCM14469_27510 [Desulfatiferula olefinivorans]